LKASNFWNIWIDTGGTFTDCIAVDPAGRYSKTKVLSSSALRGSIKKKTGNHSAIVIQSWKAPTNFIKGAEFRLMDVDHPGIPVRGFDAATSEITFDSPLPEGKLSNKSFELHFREEAPVLALRLITGTIPGGTLPPLNLRLATTKGTNALLERKGAPTLLITTEGFGDLLNIGDQKRPDLFALDVKKPQPVYGYILEIGERIDAGGNVLREPDRESFQQKISEMDLRALFSGYLPDEQL